MPLTEWMQPNDHMQWIFCSKDTKMTPIIITVVATGFWFFLFFSSTIKQIQKSVAATNNGPDTLWSFDGEIVQQLFQSF